MNCDRIARAYRWMEYAAFGRALQRRRSAFLHELHGTSRVLVMGDGDGRALRALLGFAPKAVVDYVDSSGKMLEFARLRAGDSRVTYRRADAREIDLPNAEYDAVVTHFFLDCLTQQETGELIERVSLSLKSGAIWIVSEFQQSAWWSALFVRGLYEFFRIVTGLRVRKIADYRSAFVANGFLPQQEQVACGGLLVSELWRLPKQRHASVSGNRSSEPTTLISVAPL